MRQTKSCWDGDGGAGEDKLSRPASAAPPPLHAHLTAAKMAADGRGGKVNGAGAGRVHSVTRRGQVRRSRRLSQQRPQRRAFHVRGVCRVCPPRPPRRRQKRNRRRARTKHRFSVPPGSLLPLPRSLFSWQRNRPSKTVSARKGRSIRRCPPPSERGTSPSPDPPHRLPEPTATANQRPETISRPSRCRRHRPSDGRAPPPQAAAGGERRVSAHRGCEWFCLL